MRFNGRKMQCSLMLFAMLLTVASCGVRDHGDSVSSVSENKGSGAETDTESNDEPEEPESGTVTVADFHYLEMQWQEEYVNKNDAVNKDWLYYAEPVKDETSEEGQFRECVFRNKISDVFEPEQFIVGAKNTPYIQVNTLFLDGEGNCCVLWAEREEGSEEGFGEPIGYFLEKYSDTGEMLLHVDYLPDVFGGMGESVTEGAAAEDGRLFLYRTGEEGVVFSFGADGSFEEVYTPELESLEGVAIGKDGAAYAYCVTGSSPKFAKLGEDGETYTCPKVPLQVYGGREDGVYLCDREGMWSYIPETGDVQKLWGWDDEYIQMDVNSIQQVFRADDQVVIMCREQFVNGNGSTLPSGHEIKTLVSVRSEDRSEYPGKKPLILEQSEYYTQVTDHTEYLVRRYNRQSRQYQVEIVSHEGNYEDELKNQLLRGEGPDLIGLRDMDVTELSAKGVFEDLTEYYAASSVTGDGEVLPAVRQAGTVAGKEVLVIPAFHIENLCAVRTEEMEQAAKDWTVWKFLELAEENRMFRVQSPAEAFWYCMGITPGEFFLDYEKKESRFDSEEFREILEKCGQWETYQFADCEIGSEPAFSTKDWEWLLASGSYYEMRNFILEEDVMLTGYPGFNGGECELMTEEIFAMNSASKNKEGAWEFLEFLLSEELQRGIDWAFPARVCCFEDCLQEPCMDYGTMEMRQLTEEEAETVRKWVDAAVYDKRKSSKDPVRMILSEEADMYFAGDASLDETVAKIQNRVQLYLNEL